MDGCQERAGDTTATEAYWDAKVLQQQEGKKGVLDDVFVIPNHVQWCHANDVLPNSSADDSHNDGLMMFVMIHVCPLDALHFHHRTIQGVLHPLNVCVPWDLTLCPQFREIGHGGRIVPIVR